MEIEVLVFADDDLSVIAHFDDIGFVFLQLLLVERTLADGYCYFGSLS